MRTEELHYNLPDELIAQSPAVPRDSSRLLVCRREKSQFETHLFRDLPGLLLPGDVIVTNTARVIPARLCGYKFPTGARIEVLLLERLPEISPDGNPVFKALLNRRRRLAPGDRVLVPESSLSISVVEINQNSVEGIVELGGVDDPIDEVEKVGTVPLPPYIKDYAGDLESYQTVYSKEPGSVAAPTAGLHFTPGLLGKLEGAGIKRKEIYLRVGWGTFSPIRSENVEEHRLHEEFGELDEDTADEINRIRSQGGRVVAVGTTVTRLLETAVDESGVLRPFSGRTGLFITPGYEFKSVDALITNFHLPGTSLLALVSAFLGVERTLEAYDFAVKKRFRFYSFGDAMLIL